MTLRELFNRVQLDVPATVADRPVSGVVCDSRQVRPGAVFVALRGATHDGSQFIEDAVARGASAIVSEQPVHVPGTVVRQIEDARRGFADLSAAFHGHPAADMHVCGVTGTNGKTTVTFMLRDILRAAGWSPGMIGTVQYEIGARAIPALRTTPDAGELQTLLAQMRQAGCRSVAMEVSSHAVDQKRVWAVEFDVGVFTNLTRDHLDYHGDMETYYLAKRAFFERLGWDGRPATAVVNAECPYGRRLAADLKSMTATTMTYGVGDGVAVRAVEVKSQLSGSRFVVESPWGRHPVKLRLRGDYNVSNALAAFSAGGAMGIDPALMVKALESMRTIPGRLEEVHGAPGFRVFVDYAHTDDALDNVLKTLRPLTPGRLIVVFGCGGNRDRSKREAMGAAAARGADIAVVTSDNPRKEDPATIIHEVLAGFPAGAEPLVAVDREEAIGMALTIAAGGDVILIAGKGHESFQEFSHTVVPFDDRQVARELLRSRRRGLPDDRSS